MGGLLDGRADQIAVWRWRDRLQRAVDVSSSVSLAHTVRGEGASEMTRALRTRGKNEGHEKSHPALTEGRLRVYNGREGRSVGSRCLPNDLVD